MNLNLSSQCDVGIKNITVQDIMVNMVNKWVMGNFFIHDPYHY